MSDVYKIGVNIALSNGMSPVLAVIGRDLLGLSTKVKDIEKGIGKWTIAAAGFTLAGAGIARELWKIADHGKEILHQQELLKQAGFANKEIVDATTKSWETSRKVQQTTAAENLKHIRELAYATGSIGGAQGILDPVTKANAILNSIKGGGRDQVFEMVKALEQKGLATEEERVAFLSYVDNMTKVVQATGGRVDSTMFQQTFKYGRTAMLGWSEEFITQILPRLMQSWASGISGGSGSGGGAGGPGNALMTMFAKLVQGQLSKTAAGQLEALGLTEYNRHIKGSSQSQVRVKGIETAMENPYEWIQQYMMPALKEHGITDQKSIVGIIEAISKSMGVRTAAAVATEFALQGRYRMGAEASPFEKDRRLTLQARGLGGYDSLAANDPNSIDKAYTAQKENMLSAMGVALMPVKLEVIKALTTMFTEVAKFASANPKAIQAIAIALGVLASALVVGGIVALGTAIAGMVGPAAAVAASITAFAGGIAALIAAIGAFKMPSWLGDHSNAPAVPGSTPMPRGGWHPHSTPGKQGWNVIRPSGGGQETKFAAVYLDGRKVGDAVIGHISDRASLPVEGSPYHDPTWHAMPLDTAVG